MNRHSLRRGTGLVAATAVALGGLASLSAAPASAADDQTPAKDAATWLTERLVGNQLSVGVGPSIDAALSLDATATFLGDSEYEDQAESIINRVGAIVASGGYVSSSTKTTAAENLAKVIVGAQATGVYSNTFGGENLLVRLEGVTDDTTGRISDDRPDPATPDGASTVGQSLAVRALTAGGSAEADAAGDFLLDQQCSTGYFRYTLGADGNTCADGTDPANTDVTALVLIDMVATGDPKFDGAIAGATNWLLSIQKADGAFDSTEFPGKNSNSTGVAAWALRGVGGHGVAVQKAAIWLRAHQAVSSNKCAVYATGSRGAIAYDDAGLAGLADGSMSAGDAVSAEYATAQALPGLFAAPAARPRIAGGSAKFVRAGSKQTISGRGAPGDLACATTDGGKTTTARVSAAGVFNLKVTMPARTKPVRFLILDSDETVGPTFYSVLAKKKLKVTAPRQAGRGDRVRLTARGLVHGEKVTFYMRGKKVGTDKVNLKGEASLKVRVTGKTGRVAVRATGQFGDLRKGTTSFRLTR